MTQQQLPVELVGTWTLVSYVAKGSGGEERYPSGRDPQGQLIYTADGNMAALLMRRNRPRFAANDLMAGNDAEVRSAFEGFEAYAGRVEADMAQGCVRHQLEVCRFPNWEGGTQLRYFKLEGDHLQLTTPPILARGQEWVYTLLWQRKK